MKKFKVVANVGGLVDSVIAGGAPHVTAASFDVDPQGRLWFYDEMHKPIAVYNSETWKAVSEVTDTQLKAVA